MGIRHHPNPSKAKVPTFRTLPPEPTPDDPYAQVEWLLARFNYGRVAKSQHTRRYAIKAWVAFLRSESSRDAQYEPGSPFYLKVHLNRYVLVRAVEYWRQQQYAGKTIYHRCLTLREFLELARDLGFSESQVFDNPTVSWNVRRSTNTREPLDDDELEALKQWLRSEIEYVRRFARRMTATNEDKARRLQIGDDPRKRDKGGWALWDNMVWYFEHEMHGTIRPTNEITAQGNNRFCTAARRYHGGLSQTWRRLGVALAPDTSLLAPLLIALALETGLNPQALLELRRDCYQDEHPLTSLPCLRYYKERSKGDMELHVSLLGPSDEGRMHLFADQGVILRRTIELILLVTDQLTDGASSEDRDFLFLIKPLHGTSRGEVSRLSKSAAHKSLQQLLRRVDALAPVRSLALARFRPTKICEMVRNGADILSVCAVAGHASLATTSIYLSRERILPHAESELRRGFKRAQMRNRAEYDRERPTVATPTTQGAVNVVYEGPFSLCTDVYDPPDNVKRLINWKPGQSCSFWDMCIGCDNALVLERHLPILVTYQDDLRRALAKGNLGHSGIGRQYRQTLDYLADLLGDPDDPAGAGMFSRDIVDEARLRAKGDVLFTDSVVYRGVREG